MTNQDATAAELARVKAVLDRILPSQGDLEFLDRHPCGCGAVLVPFLDVAQIQAESVEREPGMREPMHPHRFPTGYVRMRHPDHEWGPWGR